MNESTDPLSAIPSDSLLGMSFTPDEPPIPPQSSPEEPGEDQVPAPEEIPPIVRIIWELDSQVPPLERRIDGRVFILSLLSKLAEMGADTIPPEELEQMRQISHSSPATLVAFPFELDHNGDDFLYQLSRLAWSENIEGIAVIYETDSMLTVKEMEAAPVDPVERKNYIEQVTQNREKSRFVVAATRTETWSVVHPKFESDPEHIEQGPALAMDLLQIILQNSGVMVAKSDDL